MLTLFDLDLFLHDGEGDGGVGTGDGAESTGFEAADAEPQEAPEETPKDKAKRFRELTRGEFRDEYKAATQEMINKRFAGMREMEERLAKQEKVINLLHTRNGTKSIEALMEKLENDEQYLEQRAFEMNMTVDQVREYDRMQQEISEFHRMQENAERERAANEQLMRWRAEEEQVKAKYPDFDLEQEAQSEAFAAQLKAGVPIMLAYETAHHDEFMKATTAYAVRETEKAVTDNIRARGTRPVENGAAGKNGFTSSLDVSKFTNKDFEEYGRRAARGEKITFR